MRSAFLSLLLASIASAAPQMSAPVRTGTIPNAPRSASEDQPAAAIASAGNSILTAWNTGDATFVARLYPWLTADPTSIQKFALQPGHEIGGYPQIATDGSEYLVAWSELSRERTSFDVVLARFDLDGRLIEGPSIVERDATEPARLMWVNPTYQVAVPAAILIVPQHSIVIAHRAYMRPANVGVCGSDIVSARVYVTPKLCFPYSCPSPSLTAEIYWLNTGVTWTSLLLTGAFNMPITTEYACTTRRCTILFPYEDQYLNVQVFVAASPCSSVKFDSTGVLAFPGLGLSVRPAHSFVAAANGDSVLIAYEKTSAIAAALLRTDGAHVEFIEMEFIVAQGNVSRPLVVASDDGFIIAYNVAESQTTRHIEAVRIGAQPPIPRHRGVR